MSGGDLPGRFASIAVPVPLRRLFTYEVGPALASRITVGDRVRVPFGGRSLVGTVVEWPLAAPPDPEITTRPIDSLVEESRRLGPELLRLTRFVADYYLCSWGEAIETALPPDPGPAPRTRVVERLPAADPDALSSTAHAQRKVLELLPAGGEPVPVGRLGAAGQRAARALQRRGWVRISEIEQDSAPAEIDTRGGGDGVPPEPTPGQAAVLETLRPALDERAFRPFLLYGATGSGKTEVYLRAARQVLDQGRDVLYMVPEIGLTPLLVSRVERRFPGQVAVLHSGLARRARHAGWDEVRRGLRRVVIGTRSAVFAPLADLGLIVVDEEQDSSYKQSETPRYNGRDLAVVRAREAGAAVLMGSATPSMESFQHARAGRYGLLRLGGRIQERPLPEVRVVDMREEYGQAREPRIVSRALAEALSECVGRGEQALVLRNRRGWASAMLCPDCGQRVTCGRCSISLTWHQAARRLRCHHCGFEQGHPGKCPGCGGDRLNLLGEGTEQIEDLLRAAVPGAVIERMDRDTIRRQGAHEKMLRRFDDGEIDILVGTQMIAKGHDFPRVTLVGVLSADQSLGIPDFRAAERTFQLLTQVAGRAGRGTRPGSVVVQAFDPDHPVIGLAARQDYEAFFDREIVYRRVLRYPPLAALVSILIADRDPVKVRQRAREVGDALRAEAGGRLLVTGPGPAPLERLKGRFRWQILVRSAGRRRLVETVDRALAAIEGQVPRRGVQVDVDPLSLF